MRVVRSYIKECSTSHQICLHYYVRVCYTYFARTDCEKRQTVRTFTVRSLCFNIFRFHEHVLDRENHTQKSEMDRICYLLHAQYVSINTITTQ